MLGSNGYKWSPELAADLRPCTFRSALKALDRPGTAVQLVAAENGPRPLNTASAAFLSTWLNPEVPVWTDLGWESEPAAWLHAESGCSWVTEPCMAAIALITDPSRMPALEDFHIGEPDRLEASTQLVIQVPGFTAQARGVPAGETLINRPLLQIPAVMPRNFRKQWEAQRRFAPLGVDVFFTCGDLLVALPRHLHCSGAPLRKPRPGSPSRARLRTDLKSQHTRQYVSISKKQSS